MKAILSAGAFLIFCASLSAQTPVVAAGAPGQDSGSAQSNTDASPRIDPQKEASIRRLIELSGVKDNFAASLTSMSTMIRASLEKSGMNSDKARTFSDLFFEKMQAKMVSRFDSLVDMLLPVYDKYYTTEDIEGLIAFYNSPLGRKMLKNSPNVLRESQTIGYQWGSKIGEESQREVLAEHPELKPPSRVFTNQ